MVSLWAIATSGAVSVTAWPDPSCAPSRSASVIATASDYSKEVHSQTPQAGQGRDGETSPPCPATRPSTDTERASRR
jgi:hypothetical protein